MSRKKIDDVTEEFWEEEVDATNKELIEDFLSQRHLSPNTLKQYTSALKIFSKWAHDHARNLSIVKMKPRHALQYQDWLIDKGLSGHGIQMKRSAVSSLCNFIELYYSDEYPSFRNIYTKAIPNVEKSASKEKIPLTESERNKIINTLKESGDLQKLAFFMTAYSTAGRRAELVQLKKEIANYDEYKNGEGKGQGFYLSHNVRGKGKGRGGKQIKLMIGKDAMEAIKDWLDYRGEDDCEFIFVSNRGGEVKGITPNTVNLWVDSFGKIIGRKINPHLIRATRSTDIVVNEEKDVRFAQILLNHESSETTTKHYVIRDENEDLGDIFN